MEVAGKGGRKKKKEHTFKSRNIRLAQQPNHSIGIKLRRIIQIRARNNAHQERNILSLISQPILPKRKHKKKKNTGETYPWNHKRRNITLKLISRLLRTLLLIQSPTRSALQRTLPPRNLMRSRKFLLQFLECRW